MNKLGIALLLSFSASLSATGKADFTLRWQEEPTSVIDPITRWQIEQKKLSRQSPSRQGNLFGRINKAHRQRFVDPNFSAFNSDESDFGFTRSDLEKH
ncbi:hypothetical protein [uncultured Cedecea sp.]|uniref:hypothetical protein n=1 Tax=uncultured Cedecea sp. TaxID=988762 RepID=UPI002628F7C5|nr:hypothetical protein [uncultured Cedecea sp.]